MGFKGEHTSISPGSGEAGDRSFNEGSPDVVPTRRPVVSPDKVAETTPSTSAKRVVSPMTMGEPQAHAKVSHPRSDRMPQQNPASEVGTGFDKQSKEDRVLPDEPHEESPSGTREDYLRERFPEELLGQIRENGITSDYRNEFMATKFSFDTPADNREQIGRALAGTKTYSEYWRDRIAIHNAHAEERGYTPVDPDHAFAELVTNQPGAEELDEIAREVKALTEQEGWTKESTSEPFAALLDRARAIISPKNDRVPIEEIDIPDLIAERGDAREILQDRGVPADITSYVNERGVDGNYLNYLSGVLATLRSADATDDEVREAFAALPTYSDYLAGMIQFPPEMPEEQQAEILGHMTTTHGAAILDDIAAEFQAHAGDENPRAAGVTNDLRQTFFDATYIAHGPEREALVRQQFEERNGS